MPASPRRSATPASPGPRLGLLLGAAIHLAVVYGIHRSIVASSDMTVRRLAGTA